MHPAFLFLPAVLLALAQPTATRAQSRYLTKAGQVSFFSSSPIEDIEAQNHQVAAVIDAASGQVAFSVPIRGFVFKRTLMQEHFNENYLESEKYPKATFSGKAVGLSPAALAGGPQKVDVEGDLTIHGVTHRITVTSLMEMKDKQLQAVTSFVVAPADYNIAIPLLVRDNIAKSVSVRVALLCDPAPSAPAASSR